MKRIMSAPAAMAVGIAFSRGMAAVKPTMGVASVEIRPLKPSFSRSRPVMMDFDRLAGRYFSSSAE